VKLVFCRPDPEYVYVSPWEALNVWPMVTRLPWGLVVLVVVADWLQEGASLLFQDDEVEIPGDWLALLKFCARLLDPVSLKALVASVVPALVVPEVLLFVWFWLALVPLNELVPPWPSLLE
jgi:hypothetical protein